MRGLFYYTGISCWCVVASIALILAFILFYRCAKISYQFMCKPGPMFRDGFWMKVGGLVTFPYEVFILAINKNMSITVTTHNGSYGAGVQYPWRQS